MSVSLIARPMPDAPAVTRTRNPAGIAKVWGGLVIVVADIGNSKRQARP